MLPWVFQLPTETGVVGFLGIARLHAGRRYPCYVGWITGGGGHRWRTVGVRFEGARLCREPGQGDMMPLRLVRGRIQTRITDFLLLEGRQLWHSISTGRE